MTDSDHDSSFIAEALPAFIEEARGHLQSLEALLLELESDPANRELLDALFRSAHTIKGSAGIFGVLAVVEFTHHVETLLDQLRAGKQALTPDLSTLLLECSDQIRALIDAAQSGQADDPAMCAAREEIVLRLQAAYGYTAPAQPASSDAVPHVAAAAGLWRIDVRFGSELFRNGMDPVAILSYLRGLGTFADAAGDAGAIPDLDAIDPESCYLACRFSLDSTEPRERIESAFSFVRDDCTLTIEAPAMATPPPAQLPAKMGSEPVRCKEPAKSVDDASYIRVQADRLDAVINLLGELVIASAGASLLARQTRQSTLIEANQQIGMLVEEIRDSTLQLRMVPIGDTFARFRRMVRDIAAKLGKDIALEIRGGDTELDKSVVEHIVDPLMHLVRNALDHGIEMPDDRVLAGKPAQGKLTLSACHEAGSILMRIADDGRGIDRQKVLARARERGLVAQDATLTDAQIVRLIFEPGFSTVDQVTDLSGRGVGMDVVRRNIEALRGSIELSSEPGRGSCIEIRLPLTLAIIDGFLVGVGPSKFIFPLESVIEVIEGREVAVQCDDFGRKVAGLRGQLLPVVDLRRLYELESAPVERSSIVVIRTGTLRFGVLVDVLLGQHQTVIKPLARIFGGLRGISGSSILGNGEVALIFDVAALGERASETPGEKRLKPAAVRELP